MDLKNYRSILVSGTILLSGCSFASEALLPSLTGEDPSKSEQLAQATPQTAPQAAQVQRAPQPIPAQQPPAMGSSNFEPKGVTPGSNTGTFVGEKVVDLRSELSRLQTNVSKDNGDLQHVRAKTVQDSQRYHAAVSAINARLQVGTTPGNPILVDQFNQALSDLKKIGDDIGDMNVLTTRVTADSTLAAFLAENTRAAFRLSGAVDDDHQQLAILEDEVNRTVVLIDRLLKELSEDVQRQTNYVATERSNLNTLSSSIKSGEIMGASLTYRALSAATANTPTPSPMARSTVDRRPLVVIRFDRSNVAYEQALYNAVSRVLERRPNATFALVAVAPASGGAARVALNSNKAQRNTESVLRALQRMGLPPQRIGISARTSGAAQSNEVHLYLN